MKLFTLVIIAGAAVIAAVATPPAFGAVIEGAEQGGRPLFAVLNGADEVPGPGDPNGSGTAIVTLNQGQGVVCFEIQVTEITLPATAAHIHAAPAGVAGPVVVPLSAPDATGLARGCVEATPALIKAIRQAAEDYYVNVHTIDFPAGAVRGQLSN
jgi:hypothetical protein